MNPIWLKEPSNKSYEHFIEFFLRSDFSPWNFKTFSCPKSYFRFWNFNKKISKNRPYFVIGAINRKERQRKNKRRNKKRKIKRNKNRKNQKERRKKKQNPKKHVFKKLSHFSVQPFLYAALVPQPPRSQVTANINWRMDGRMDG